MVVVSVNYDMVLLAIEENDPVVWLDTRRRGNLVYEEMVVRMFRGAPSWEKLTGPGIVVQALKTKDVALTFDGARRLVTGRMTRARRARAKAADRRSSSGPTLMDGPSVE
ncbi:MAG: hypothetical protein GY798_14910 [Hyphomicrobiales bacterium]|nr:hypothetical protein [Hyphomicrobiales bacterium]